MSLPWLFEMRLETFLLVREKELPFTFGGLSWGRTVYVVLRVILFFVKGLVWRSSLEMR